MSNTTEKKTYVANFKSFGNYGAIKGRIYIDKIGIGEGLYLLVGTLRFIPVNGVRYQLAFYKGRIESPLPIIKDDPIHGVGYVPAEDPVRLYPYAGIKYNESSDEELSLQVVCYAYLYKNDYVELHFSHQEGSDKVINNHVGKDRKSTRLNSSH